MRLNNIREGELKEVLDALEEAFTATGIDYYLIGAQARDIWFYKERKLARQTNDVDFAVLVGSLPDYEKVRRYLENHKHFKAVKHNMFVMLSPTGMQVDILPFGAIEINDGVEIKGEGLTSIKVNGFMEVYQCGTEAVKMPTGHQFKIATLPAIVLLKLIAYDDRPENRLKDPSDISSIIEHFFDLQANLIYEKHNDLFTDDTVTLQEISATVIGREIKKITQGNAELLTRLKNILETQIRLNEKGPFVRAMITGTQDTVEAKIRLLLNIYSSL